MKATGPRSTNPVFGRDPLPSYLALRKTGELGDRIACARALMASCTLCPRHCGVNRLEGEAGACGAGFLPCVSSYNVHHGEEPPISGSLGSGTIFFSHCPVRCVHCQNYPISHLGHGQTVSFDRLADMMLALQNRGCHNINFVTPTHYTFQLLESVARAARKGLRIPLLSNTSGYESVEVLKLLDGVIDIYLPDLKYGDDRTAGRITGIEDFAPINRRAVREMYRQVGDLAVTEEGIAARGLIIRHLVLPGGLAGSEKVFAFLAGEISPLVHVSLMAQYFPASQAVRNPELNRRITPEEYEEAREQMLAAGLTNCFVQAL